jgi:hypothetical protein
VALDEIDRVPSVLVLGRESLRVAFREQQDALAGAVRLAQMRDSINDDG